MLEFEGKYGKAVVMLDELEQKTISQIYEFLNHPGFINDIRIMPDTHVGKGSVIGFTMPLNPDMVIPNIVGVDINCGMYFFFVGKGIFISMSRKEIDDRIRERVPFGTSVHKKPVKIDTGFWPSVTADYRIFVMKFNKKYGTSYTPINFTEDWLRNKCDQIGMDYTRAVQSIGTLGGGNHFIELGQSENTGNYGFTIHSGSRQLGLKIANYWQKKAGKGQLAYLTGDDMFGYLGDTIFAQAYASLSRLHMARHIVDACDLDWEMDVSGIIKTNHNFIDFDDFIIRKGAIRSYKGELMIIPFNMEDGILICEGKSNPYWNYSAPHGAGRVDSRRWAKENLDLKKAKNNMDKKKIYYSKLPIDETKEAYKPAELIEKAIAPTATIVDRLKPIIAMKDD